MSYWNSEGTYQTQYEELWNLVPKEGEVKKGMCKHVFSLERFRKACNSYYDVFNNGGGNRDASTAKFFPGVLYSLQYSRKSGYNVDWEYVHRICDEKMDKIIREAYVKNIGEIV